MRRCNGRSKFPCLPSPYGQHSQATTVLQVRLRSILNGRRRGRSSWWVRPPSFATGNLIELIRNQKRASGWDRFFLCLAP